MPLQILHSHEWHRHWARPHDLRMPWLIISSLLFHPTYGWRSRQIMVAVVTTVNALTLVAEHARLDISSLFLEPWSHDATHLPASHPYRFSELLSLTLVEEDARFDCQKLFLDVFVCVMEGLCFVLIFINGLAHCAPLIFISTRDRKKVSHRLGTFVDVVENTLTCDKVAIEGLTRVSAATANGQATTCKGKHVNIGSQTGAIGAVAMHLREFGNKLGEGEGVGGLDGNGHA